MPKQLFNDFKKLDTMFATMMVFLRDNNVDTDFIVNIMKGIHKDIDKSQEGYITITPFPTLSSTNRIDLDSFKLRYKKYLSSIISFLGEIKDRYPWLDVKKIIDALNKVDLKALWESGVVK